MEIITGYFMSKGQAVEAAEYLRSHGFKGKISVIGRHNKEDDREIEQSDASDISSTFDTKVLDGFTSIPVAITAFVFQGPAGGVSIIDPNNQVFSGGLNRTLADWGIPKIISEEIKSVVGSGNSIILIESDENDKVFVKDTLKVKGAQNIHI